MRSVPEHVGFRPPQPQALPAAALKAASRTTTTVPHQHRAAMPGDAVRRCRHWGSGPVRTWRSLARLRLAPNSGSGTGQLPDQRSNRPAGRHEMSARDGRAWCVDVTVRRSWQVAAPTRGRHRSCSRQVRQADAGSVGTCADQCHHGVARQATVSISRYNRQASMAHFMRARVRCSCSPTPPSLQQAMTFTCPCAA